MEMVHHTRLDVSLSAAAIMRIAVSHAAHYAAHRTAFQKRLTDQPAMRRVIADIALESEAATALAMRVARAFDRAADDPAERAFARIAVALAKFWICKRTPPLVAELLEVHGGNGYVETWPMARLYREAPLNGIWEGTGNVMALDVLRATTREPETVEVLRAELAPARGADRRLDAHLGRLEALLAKPREVRCPPYRGLARHGAAGIAARAPWSGFPGRCLLCGAARGGRRPRLRHAP